LRNPKKSFSTVLLIHTSDNLRYIIQKKQTATVVLQLICLLTVVYSSCYLRSPIFYG